VAMCLSGKVLVLISEFILYQTGLVWQTCKPPWYAISHPGQLSLAIPSSIGAMSTSEIWE